jgi:arabinofuranosyltransferase
LTIKKTLAVAIILFTGLSYIYFPESIDDAYITLRYSQNLLQGIGLVFNEAYPVEGFSNFSWVILLAAIGYFGIPMEYAMKVISFTSGVGCLVQVWLLSRKIFVKNVAVAASVFFLGTSSFFALWSVDGLETMFYTFLLTSMLFILTFKEPKFLLLSFVMAITCLTRPEGVMFAGVVVIWLLFHHGFYVALKVALPSAIIFAGYLFFRWTFFGLLVANTALVKVHPGLISIENGFKYLLSFNESSGYIFLPILIVGLVILRRNKFLLLPFLFILVQLIFIMISGGDFMFGYRFLVPIIPCFILIISNIFDQISISHSRASTILAFFTVTIIAFSQYLSLPLKHIGFDNIHFRASPLFDIANFISKNTDNSDWVLISEAGIISYYIKANVVDYLGLVSPYLMVYKNKSVNNDYLFINKPKYVVISFIEDDRGVIRPRLGSESQILSYPYFNENYRYIKNYNIDRGTSFLNEIYYRYSPEAKLIFFKVFERK